MVSVDTLPFTSVNDVATEPSFSLTPPVPLITRARGWPSIPLSAVLTPEIAVPTGDENVTVGFAYLDGIVYPKFTGVNNVKNTLFNISNNYPNPFSGSTSFDMNLNASANVVVTITNLLGQQVKEAVNATYTAGAHTIKIDASNLNAGVYFYNVNAGGFVMTQKMIVK